MRAALMGLLLVLGSQQSSLLSVSTARDDPRPQDAAARSIDKAKERSTQPASDAERQALDQFKHDVEQYASLSRKLAGARGPSKSSDAKALEAGRKALAEAIRTERSTASQGEIFRPEVQPFFRHLIGSDLKGQDGRAARKAVREGNPAHEPDSPPVPLRVNADYTQGAALSTVPPSLLLTLPQLPKPLEYRFVGGSLILLDTAAAIIVDFLPAATGGLEK